MKKEVKKEKLTKKEVKSSKKEEPKKKEVKARVRSFLRNMDMKYYMVSTV